MDFEKLIADRYSVRKFKDEPLKREDINKILQAGHLAPTGCNAQPQRILVLSTPESMEKLKPCTRCHFDAPCAMLVCYNKNESWVRSFDGALSAPVDAGIITTHMMLQAHNIGVGTCWVMSFNPDEIKKAFNIPENIIPSALLVMGYPHDEAAPLYMHSEFRPMEETVFFDSF